MNTVVIGKGTWIDKLADDLLVRERNLGRSLDTIVVESGLGASGVPHIGSLGDAIRSYGVKLALESRGYDSKLVAYSDDLDGLRKVPAGFPDSLQEHIAKPVSLIPDPSGCYDSYGARMSSILLDGLDKLGITYEFRRAYDTYRNGLLAAQTHKILKNASIIGKQIHKMVGQDKYLQSLPYFAVCGNCDKIYTTNAYRYDAEAKCVLYTCSDTSIGGRTINGCGHSGSVDINGDLGKLAWKVEFAARWNAFDVRFEAYGKDIMDSVQINDWVSDSILEYPPPHHVKYEMFLDRGGKKISKSLGNVVTAQDWLQIGTAQSLLLLLYKRIKGARQLGLEDVPLLMNEYNELEDIYFGKTRLNNSERESRLRGLYEYANLLTPPTKPSVHVNYMLLVELAKIFGQDRQYHITKKLVEYKIISGSSPHVDRMIEMAGKYADEHAEVKRLRPHITEKVQIALDRLAVSLQNNPQGDPQTMIYDIAKSRGVKPRDFFQIIYQIVLGTNAGPRLGPLISDIGFGKVAKMLIRCVREDGPQ